MIFLDTHVLIWLYAGKLRKLSAVVKKWLEKSDTPLISPMVLLEVELLYEIGKIRESASPVYEYLHKKLGLNLCHQPFVEVIAQASKNTWTRDPFDRIIVAQAMLSHSSLLTADESIREHYKKAIW